MILFWSNIAGIGRAICILCAREGAHVYIVDKRQTPLEGGATTMETISALEPTGRFTFINVGCDFGRIDIPF